VDCYRILEVRKRKDRVLVDSLLLYQWRLLSANIVNLARAVECISLIYDWHIPGCSSLNLNKFWDIGIGVELDCKKRFVGWPRMRRGKFGELATHHLMQVAVGLLTAAGAVENLSAVAALFAPSAKQTVKRAYWAEGDRNVLESCHQQRSKGQSPRRPKHRTY
jgi:hypothetical protein